jgi:hypothetical protein
MPEPVALLSSIALWSITCKSNWMSFILSFLRRRNISSYYAGGYIFFSTIPERKALIELVLQTMELSPQEKLDVWLPRNEDHDSTDLPQEQALLELAHAQDGGFYVDTPGRPECYWFDQSAGPYTTVRVSSIINALEEQIDPSGPELMAKRWLALCEQGKADFGFFGQFDQMIELEYRDKLLHALLQKDVRKLLASWDAYWLIYFGPDLATRWRALQQPLQAIEKRWLPSGAFFARASSSLYH